MAGKSDRPDYITCIKQTYNTSLSWCGRHISTEFSFQNIDHAKNAVNTGSRLTICHECWTKIQDKVDSYISRLEEKEENSDNRQ